MGEVRVEKQGYYKRRGEGATTLREPDGALSLILDGEDQNETTFPHQPRVPENVERYHTTPHHTSLNHIY